MNLKAEKLSVLEQTINTNDFSLIRDIKSLLKNRDLDWFEGLNEIQKKDVEEGVSQLDKGEFLGHDEVKKKFNF